RQRRTSLLRLAIAAWAFGCSREAQVGTSSDVAPQPFAVCSPSAAEICNGHDDDCDGSADENAVCANRCQAAAIIQPQPPFNPGQCAIRGDGRLVCWSVDGLLISPDDPALQADVSQF